MSKAFKIIFIFFITVLIPVAVFAADVKEGVGESNAFIKDFFNAGYHFTHLVNWKSNIFQLIFFIFSRLSYDIYEIFSDSFKILLPIILVISFIFKYWKYAITPPSDGKKVLTDLWNFLFKGVFAYTILFFPPKLFMEYTATPLTSAVIDYGVVMLDDVLNEEYKHLHSGDKTEIEFNDDGTIASWTTASKTYNFGPGSDIKESVKINVNGIEVFVTPEGKLGAWTGENADSSRFFLDDGSYDKDKLVFDKDGLITGWMKDNVEYELETSNEIILADVTLSINENGAITSLESKRFSTIFVPSSTGDDNLFDLRIGDAVYKIRMNGTIKEVVYPDAEKDKAENKENYNLDIKNVPKIKLNDKIYYFNDDGTMAKVVDTGILCSEIPKVEEEYGLPDSLRVNMVCLISIVSKLYDKGMEFGGYLMKYSVAPDAEVEIETTDDTVQRTASFDIIMFLSGLFIWFFFFLGSLAVIFLIIDVAIRFGIIVIFIPLAIFFWIFPKETGVNNVYKKLWDMLLYNAAVFLMIFVLFAFTYYFMVEIFSMEFEAQGISASEGNPYNMYIFLDSIDGANNPREMVSNYMQTSLWHSLVILIGAVIGFYMMTNIESYASTFGGSPGPKYGDDVKKTVGQIGGKIFGAAKSGAKKIYKKIKK